MIGVVVRHNRAGRRRFLEVVNLARVDAPVIRERRRLFVGVERQMRRMRRVAAAEAARAGCEWWYINPWDDAS